ncbi:MAG: sugar phosphate isomerase/epimerase [Bauldia sp.]|nr:sugar phosphate isomerase/epimerase [Bauldia sp.]
MAQKREYIMWSGNVRNLPFPERIRVTAKAGFDVLTLSPYDWLDAMRTGLSTADLIAMAGDAGIRIDHLDPLARWAPEWMPDNITEPTYLAFLACDTDDFLRIAETLRITSMSAICSFPAGAEVDVDRLTEAFATLCDRAAGVGVRCDLEFVPMWGLRDLETAWAIVDGADRANSGLIFDFYHYLRGKPDDALLERIPADKISSVQVADAAEKINPNISLFQDCIFRRVQPGEGDFPVTRLLQILERKGAIRRIGPEVFSQVQDQMSGDRIADVTTHAFRRVLDAAGIDHDFPRRHQD